MKTFKVLIKVGVFLFVSYLLFSYYPKYSYLYYVNNGDTITQINLDSWYYQDLGRKTWFVRGQYDNKKIPENNYIQIKYDFSNGYRGAINWVNSVPVFYFSNSENRFFSVNIKGDPRMKVINMPDNEYYSKYKEAIYFIGAP